MYFFKYIRTVDTLLVVRQFPSVFGKGMQNYVNYTGDWDGVEVAADGTATGRSELKLDW